MLLNRFVLAPWFAVGILGGSAQAHASLITTFGGDAAFLAFQASSGFTKVGGANVRWGNNATTGDWEYAVVNASDIPLSQGQLELSALAGYSSGTDTVANMQFTFSYTAAGLLSVSLRDINGNPVGSVPTVSGSVTPNPGVNTLALRANIGEGDYAVIGPGSTSGGDPSAAGVQGLRVNFTSGGFFDLGRLSGDIGAEYLMLTDSRLAGGFSITDTATLRDGSGSLPMWQFKLGISPVPLPAALPLLAAGLGVMGWMGRRHRHPAAAA